MRKGAYQSGVLAPWGAGTGGGPTEDRLLRSTSCFRFILKQQSRKANLELGIGTSCGHETLPLTLKATEPLQLKVEVHQRAHAVCKPGHPRYCLQAVLPLVDFLEGHRHSDRAWGRRSDVRNRVQGGHTAADSAVIDGQPAFFLHCRLCWKGDLEASGALSDDGRSAHLPQPTGRSPDITQVGVARREPDYVDGHITINGNRCFAQRGRVRSIGAFDLARKRDGGRHRVVLRQSYRRNMAAKPRGHLRVTRANGSIG